MKLSLQELLAREGVIKAIRSFFDERGFHEVITPVLNNALPLEENLFSFRTQWNAGHGSQSFFLPTSPESNLKKLLAQGIGNCYSIGHTFRNLENSGSLHSPEFLMLEWYREDADYKQIMEDTKELVTFVRQQAIGNSSQQDETDAWITISLETLFKEHAQVDLEDIADNARLFDLASNKGYSVENTSWSQLFDQIFLNEVESHLPKEPFFLVDFPARMSPLCTLQKDKQYLAERFEVYIDGIEIGNGNTENLDADTVLANFKQIAANRSQQDLDSHPYDLEFIEALRTLQQTGKNYAGIGLGVERLTKIISENNG